MPLFWTSGDVCPGFQCQGGSLACVLSRLHAMDVSDSFASCIVLSMAAEPFGPTYLQTCPQALVGLERTQ